MWDHATKMKTDLACENKSLTSSPSLESFDVLRHDNLRLCRPIRPRTRFRPQSLSCWATSSRS